MIESDFVVRFKFSFRKKKSSWLSGFSHCLSSLCGPRFKPVLGPGFFFFQSLFQDFVGFPYRVFPPMSTTEISSLSSLQNVGVLFPLGRFADYTCIIQIQKTNAGIFDL